MSTPGQISLNNFYQSVKFANPELAEHIRHDVGVVALYGLSADKTGGQEAAKRLRENTRFLSPVLSMVLGNALIDLGYS